LVLSEGLTIEREKASHSDKERMFRVGTGRELTIDPEQSGGLTIEREEARRSGQGWKGWRWDGTVFPGREGRFDGAQNGGGRGGCGEK
jgi:hypothetical protein